MRSIVGARGREKPQFRNSSIEFEIVLLAIEIWRRQILDYFVHDAAETYAAHLTWLSVSSVDVLDISDAMYISILRSVWIKKKIPNDQTTSKSKMQCKSGILTMDPQQ